MAVLIAAERRALRANFRFLHAPALRSSVSVQAVGASRSGLGIADGWFSDSARPRRKKLTVVPLLVFRGSACCKACRLANVSPEKVFEQSSQWSNRSSGRTGENELQYLPCLLACLPEKLTSVIVVGWDRACCPRTD